jgi:hypothetical protein
MNHPPAGPRPDGPAAAVGDHQIGIDAQAVVDGGADIGGADRAVPDIGGLAVGFADHGAATAEMVRTCRPGGQIGLTSWHQSSDTWFRTWRDAAAAAELFPPAAPGAPDPDSWGDQEKMDARLRAAGVEPSVTSRPFTWDFASVEAALDYFFTVSGPFVALQAGAAAMGRGDEPRAVLGEAVRAAGGNGDGSVSLRSPYLLATARR